MGFPFALSLPTLAPAVVATALFSLAFVGLLYRTVRSKGFVVYIFLDIFCAIRAAAYGCRTGWSQQLDASQITPIIYVANILLAAGFIIVLFAEFNLFVAWIHLGLRRAQTPPAWEQRMFKITRVLLPIFQILTVVGAIMLLVASANGDLSAIQTANNLRNAGTYGFFGLAIIHMFLVIAYYWYFRNLEIEHLHNEHLIILFGMSALVIIKLVYKVMAANASRTDPLNADERYFYGLDTLPEFLVMLWGIWWNLAEVKMGIEKPKKKDVEVAESEDSVIEFAEVGGLPVKEEK